MIYSLSIGIGATVAMVLGWISIQTVWKRLFEDYISDEDALAGRRSSCQGGGCGCGLACPRKVNKKLKHD
ncbi:hypothetical protein [Reichenbachiella ulvae]|uniref:4Fe-4S ferredoxin-type domain-containing protein n=1 Tax=Reichenbachiella ulvae TaxID=2980104 RepID=A0ABT3CUY6_9BACT|nr:hypothetical protein [Reichenbachiella ulvae]MCV9387285.1 hypothetical protein [Reichenbachiella ulvae]